MAKSTQCGVRWLGFKFGLLEAEESILASLSLISLICKIRIIVVSTPKSVKMINYVDLSSTDILKSEMTQRWGNSIAGFFIQHKSRKRNWTEDLEAVNCKTSLGTLLSRKISLFPVKGVLKSVESILLNFVLQTSNHRFTLFISKIFWLCHTATAQKNWELPLKGINRILQPPERISFCSTWPSVM